MSVEILNIGEMGARGDGIALDGKDRVFVPLTLPGERVRVLRAGARASLQEVLHPSPERVLPPCPHFGACGGCQLQHWHLEAYRAFKRERVLSALHRAGIAADVEDLVDATGEGRRRVTLHARDGKTGYFALRSHEIVEIETCPILAPSLKTAPVLARRIGEAFESSDIAITATDTGLDIAVTAKKRPSGDLIKTLGRERAIARLTLDGEILALNRPPQIAIGKAQVALPPASFLQATKAAEMALADAVVRACAGRKRIADLFCGVGPFALRLAEKAKVFAADADKAAVEACDSALRATPGLKVIGTEVRDLFRDPLLPMDLKPFDAVVFDPPRAGARAQAAELAKSKVPLIVGVSCDPETFARDAALLIAGGYRLEQVTPFDQFLWSAHVELVGAFRR